MTRGVPRTGRAVAAATALLVAAPGCTGDASGEAATGRLANGAGFRILVPDGWEEASDGPTARAGSWLGPVEEDGTRVGLWVETACMAGSLDAEVDFLQSPDANYEGYEVVEPGTQVDLDGADRAVEWQATYELPMAADGELATIRRVQLLAALDDDSVAHVIYEGRDRHVDLDHGRALVRSVELDPLGCDDGEVDA